jgi:predicted transcriptional regulator YdeE
MIIEMKQGFDVIGITMTTTTDLKENLKDYIDIWGQFKTDDVMSKIKGKISEEVICVYDNYKELSKDRYEVRVTIGSKVNQTKEIPEGMITTSVKPTNYQRFVAKGELPQCIMTEWESIWEKNNSLNRAFSTDYEVYGEKANDKVNGEMEIFLSVSK